MNPGVNTPSIVAQSISKTFKSGHCALRELSCTIHAGERIAIVGANGAGKSTALRLLNLSHRPTVGTISWHGTDTSTLSSEAVRRIRSRIGTVPQTYDLIPQLTVRANVLTGRLGRYPLFESFWSMFSERDRHEVERVLGVVGIAHLIDERCNRLSGGEQQRVAIARALFQNPELLFADEPLAAVDPAGATRLMELLVEICKTSGCALIMTSHQLHLLKDYFPRVIGLRQGEVFFDLKAEDLSPRILSALYGLGGDVRPAFAQRTVVNDSPRKRLRIGVSPLGCEFVASHLLPELARMHPGLKLCVCTEDDAELATEIERGTIDIAFVLNGRASDELGLIPLRQERVVLVTAQPSSSMLLAPEELAEMTLLWADSNHPVSRHVLAVVEAKAVQLGECGHSMELDSITSVKSAVISGLGYAFVPRTLVSSELEDGVLHEVRVAGLEVSYPIYAMRRLGGEAADLIDSVVELASGNRIRPAV